MIYYRLLLKSCQSNKESSNPQIDALEIASAFPKAREIIRIGDLIHEPTELLHLPDFVGAMLGGKGIPSPCADLNMPMYILIMASYFLRSGIYETGLIDIRKNKISDPDLEHNAMFLVAGSHLTRYIFPIDFANYDSARDFTGIVEVRTQQLYEYNMRLYQSVAKATIKSA